MPTSTSTQTPANPSELPPAALALAAKLFDFARDGNLESLSQYLNAGIPPNMCNHSGDSLLMLAAYHGNVSTTRLLLDQGADPDMLNGRGQSIIAGAVFKGYDEVIKLLLEKGSDIRKGVPDAVQTARMFRRRDVLRWFGVDESQEPPLPGTIPTGPDMRGVSTHEVQAEGRESAAERAEGHTI